VAHVNIMHGVTELTIRLKQPHDFAPGQFVFLSALPAAHGLTKELHPFSVSAIVNDITFRLSCKQLGDYTRQLARVQLDDQVIIYGPYGTFGARAQHGSQRQIWIAGGIGITPFLSLLRDERARDEGLQRQITLFWTVRNAQDAVYWDEIMQIPHVTVHLHVSSVSGAITAGQIIDSVDAQDLTNTTILMCGPVGMMRSLTTQFVARGVPHHRVVTEEFTLR
jgi:predicted ferric reductase